jgi:hypothetical protein
MSNETSRSTLHSFTQRWPQSRGRSRRPRQLTRAALTVARYGRLVSREVGLRHSLVPRLVGSTPRPAENSSPVSRVIASGEAPRRRHKRRSRCRRCRVARGRDAKRRPNHACVVRRATRVGDRRLTKSRVGRISAACRRVLARGLASGRTPSEKPSRAPRNPPTTAAMVTSIPTTHAVPPNPDRIPQTGQSRGRKGRIDRDFVAFLDFCGAVDNKAPPQTTWGSRQSIESTCITRHKDRVTPVWLRQRQATEN